MFQKPELHEAEEREDTEVEENLKVSLYKMEVYLLKIIPIILALLDILNTFLSLFHIQVPIISYIGGVSFLSLAFLYLSSYVFKFCEYHRVPLHFIVVNNLINIYDWYIGIPIDLVGIILFESILIGITIFLMIYLHERDNKKFTKRNNKRYRRRQH